MLPLSLPFAHRYSRSVLVRAVTLFGVLSVIGMVAFSMRQPFDAMHQKRVFVIHAENVMEFVLSVLDAGVDSCYDR